MMTKCLYYLETNPNESFVASMQADVKKRLKTISEGYMTWCASLTSSENRMDETKLKAKYNTEMDTKKYKEQLSALNYILS